MVDRLIKRLEKWANNNQKELGINTENDGQLQPYISYECRLPIEEDCPEAKADLYIHTKKGKAHIFIELERSAGRGVVNNVAKYWPWDERGLDNHKRDKICLIQIFNPVTFSRGNYQSSIEVAKFIARKMKQERGSRFQYRPIEFDMARGWERRAFNECTEEIKRICSKKRNI